MEKKYIKTIRNFRCLTTSSSTKNTRIKKNSKNDKNCKNEKNEKLSDKISVNKVKKKNYITASNCQSASKNKKLESIIKLYSHVDRKSSYGYSSARNSERRNLALSSSEKKKEMKSEFFSDSIIIKLKILVW